MKIENEQSVWGQANSLDFFRDERQSPEDLYPSERVFLPDAVKRAKSILDVGCACGGFAAIMHSFNENLKYTGIDIVPEMLFRARKLQTAASFAAAAGQQLPFASQSFDLVHCSGSVHLNLRYRELIADMWRVTRHQLLFDVRLTEGPSMEGRFRVDFDKTGEGGLLPYIVINIDETRDLIDKILGAPDHVRLYGYHHPASSTAILPNGNNLIMAFLLLSRTSTESGWDVTIEDDAPK